MEPIFAGKRRKCLTIPQNSTRCAQYGVVVLKDVSVDASAKLRGGGGRKGV